MDHPATSRRGRRTATAAFAVFAIAAISGPAAFAQDPAQPYAGTTVNVSTYASVPEFDFYKTVLPAFTEKTGIEVNYVQQPVAAQDQKIPLQLSAKDDSLDVFFTGSENIGSYVGIEGVTPLDEFINNPDLTPAEWNFADIAPAVEAACQQDGVTYCIASHTGGGLLYYNTRMFEEAGITAPPRHPEELLADAKLLKKDGQDGFCVRGDKSQALYDAFQLWQWFYPYDNDKTGNYFDADWKFGLGVEPYASQFGEWYRELLTTTANEGIATYLVTNCLQDFQQGRVAMWHDDSGTIPEVLNEENSARRQGDRLLVAPVPGSQPRSLQPRPAVRHLDQQCFQEQGGRVAPGPVPDLQGGPGRCGTGRRAADPVPAVGADGSRDGRGAAADLPGGADRHPQPSQRGAAAVHPRGRGHHPADRRWTVGAHHQPGSGGGHHGPHDRRRRTPS